MGVETSDTVSLSTTGVGVSTTTGGEMGFEAGVSTTFFWGVAGVTAAI